MHAFMFSFGRKSMSLDQTKLLQTKLPNPYEYLLTISLWNNLFGINSHGVSSIFGWSLLVKSYVLGWKLFVCTCEHFCYITTKMIWFKSCKIVSYTKHYSKFNFYVIPTLHLNDGHFHGVWQMLILIHKFLELTLSYSWTFLFDSLYHNINLCRPTCCTFVCEIERCVCICKLVCVHLYTKQLSTLCFR